MNSCFNVIYFGKKHDIFYVIVRKSLVSVVASELVLVVVQLALDFLSNDAVVSVQAQSASWWAWSTWSTSVTLWAWNTLLTVDTITTWLAWSTLVTWSASNTAITGITWESVLAWSTVVTWAAWLARSPGFPFRPGLPGAPGGPQRPGLP